MGDTWIGRRKSDGKVFAGRSHLALDSADVMHLRDDGQRMGCGALVAEEPVPAKEGNIAEITCVKCLEVSNG